MHDTKSRLLAKSPLNPR